MGSQANIIISMTLAGERRYKHGQHYVAELHRPRVKNAFNDATLVQAIGDYKATISH